MYIERVFRNGYPFFVIKGLSFVSSFVVADSLVLIIRHCAKRQNVMPHPKMTLQHKTN